LLALLDDILDFSKIEAGRIDLECLPFSLRESLGDTMKSLGLRADRKGLELAFHVAPDVPDGLVGDAGRLRQVIVNLIGNAIKFAEHGEVVLDGQRADTATAASGNGRMADTHMNLPSDEAARSRATAGSTVRLQFSVSDTGIGIPLEKQAAV